MGEATVRRKAGPESSTGEEIGIQPWDDGTLPLAVRAALGVDPATVAVSNAIPWSWVVGKANARPFDTDVKNRAADFWRAMLRQMKIERIVAAGAIARDVMRQALSDRSDIKVDHWVLPSPRLSSAGSMFEPVDLMARFRIDPSVQQIIMAPGNTINERQALYVCHAVSRSRSEDTGR